MLTNKRNHRPQKQDLIEDTGERPLVVKPLEQLDRMHNPKDIEPDEQAMLAGVAHGGMMESRFESLQTRGSGGRKRSQSAPVGHHRSGRDVSKKR